ncbi:MAG: hypothetical protein PHU25_20615 [Deltaproteobacteria bacterium]|nr:hypothetical protein [Deltaproteobacteria bacterium]
MRWPSSALALFALLAARCEDGPTAEDRRDFAELERAIGEMSDVADAEQGDRLQQLADLAVGSARVRIVRDLCVKAYRAFAVSNGKLALARAETYEVESAVARAKASNPGDGGLPPGEAGRLRGLQADAVKALDGATASLDRAEGLVKACQKDRAALRAFVGR